MILSIVIYTATALMLYLLADNVSKRETIACGYGTQISFWGLEIVTSILIFGFIAGARYNVGVDHLSYLSEYLSIQHTGHPSRETFEPGFLLITKAFANSGLHFFFYFAFLAILQIGFIYYALRDRKYLLPYIGLLVMLGPYFLNWMNGIRQCIVMCFFVFLVEFIIKKKFWYYAAGILLATTMHRSALILLPVYFIFFKDFKLENNKILLLILLLCIIVGSTPTWLHIMTNLDGLLAFLGYDRYSQEIGRMVSEGLRDTAWGPSRIGLLVIDIAIIWFYPGMRDYYKDDKYLPIYFLLFLIGTYLYNLFVNTSHIFIRPIGYFTIFKLPLTAYLLYYLYSIRNNIAFWVLCIVAYTHIYFMVYKATIIHNVANETSIYKFFFDHTDALNSLLL